MSDYSLISSTLYDPYLRQLKWNSSSPFLLLHYHAQRLQDAAELHQWPQAQAAVSLEALQAVVASAIETYTGTPSEAFRVRIVLTKQGKLTASAFPVAPLSLDPTSACFFKPFADSSFAYHPLLVIHPDTVTTPSSIFTRTKTTHRVHYDDARTRVHVPPYGTASSGPPMDVLLYNSKHQITETSIHNVAFYRGSHWVTPALSSGCLPGVMRRWLVEQGRIREVDPKTLTRDTIQDGDWTLVFNGVQGCKLGRIRMPAPEAST